MNNLYIQSSVIFPTKKEKTNLKSDLTYQGLLNIVVSDHEKSLV